MNKNILNVKKKFVILIWYSFSIELIADTKHCLTFHYNSFFPINMLEGTQPIIPSLGDALVTHDARIK